MSLSRRQRLALIQHINALIQPEFESLLYALNPSDGVIPSGLSAQGNRSSVLLQWVESPNGCGMDELLDILGAIAPLPSSLADLSSSSSLTVETPERWSQPIHSPTLTRPTPTSTAQASPVMSDVASRGIQLFLAHAKEDEGAVLDLYERLQSNGYHPWLDKKDLLPGQNWREEIPKAIKASQLFVACLSRTSVVKQGYVQREFRLALSELANKPSGQIYLIPLRLDACELPDIRLDEYGVNLRDYQWLDYFEPDGFSRLEQTISYQFGELLSSQEVSSSVLVSSLPQGVQKTVEPRPKTITINETVVERPSSEWTFEYEVVQVDRRGTIVERQRSQAVYESVDLGNGITLELVQIPSGRFLMGSPSDEEGRFDKETPQHQVIVQPFCMGRYPITQEQWRAIASMPQVNRALEPAPSSFKGDRLPVENVSWDEAVEACGRLTAYTGHLYRLPSEAEWEYACRAETTTPFHFGPTITTDYANYCGIDTDYGKGSYGPGPLGEYRKETTAVGSFGIANAFGLSDMHGNVWEWCQDHWHDDYQGAPLDGSAWEEDPLHNNRRVTRGGSWYAYPRNCRSAYRFGFDSVDRGSYLGFRVVASAPRTQ